MKLHESIDVGGKSINTILHDRESLIHLFTEITNIKLDKPKPPIYLPKPRVYLLESRIDLPRPRVRPSESGSHQPFQ